MGGVIIMKLEIKNLIKKYGNEEVLNIESFEIDEVKSLAIVGPSGGGKSTLLKILATIEDGDGEFLKVNNINLLDSKTHKDYLKEVGYVFQSNNLFPNLTVLENITIHLIYTYGLKEEQAIDNAHMWLKKVGIYEQKDKKPHEISGGQAQRAAIVRALITGASLLILDEPTSALDPKLAYEVMQTLLDIKEDADTIIVTHELNFAKRFADYYIFVCEGKIIDHGQIDKLFNSDNKSVCEFVDMVKFK